jgi:hypothetical protein
MALTLLLSTVGTLLLLEFGVRIYRGQLFSLPGRSAGLDLIRSGYPASYDPLLGYVPTPGTHGTDNIWKTEVNITADGFRSNGNDAPPSGTPILAVGDSMTFGDEVDDDETWPAQLERLLRRPVVNGGVFGYGFDQIALRAEQLLPHVPADILIVSVLPESILRSEFSYRFAAKPYFRVVKGALVLENVPIPEPESGRSGESTWKRGLRWSHLADALLRRYQPEGWLVPAMRREHRDGVAVGRLLVERIAELARERSLELLFVLQYIPSLTSEPKFGVVERAREIGIEVLDLEIRFRELIDEGRTTVRRIYRVHPMKGGTWLPGHMSAEGNLLAARLIADRLDSMGALQRSEPAAVAR